jgi:hypothetical protein
LTTAIIYAAASGRVRRIISEVDLGALTSHASDGEAVALWSTYDILWGDPLPDVDAATAHVAALLKIAVPSSRCVALDANNTVTQVLMADPLLDMFGDCQIVQDDDAQIGQTLQSDGSWA